MIVVMTLIFVALDGWAQGTDRAMELFEAGQNAHQAGELTKAIDLYSQALAVEKDLWQAEYQRSLALMTLNRLPEARSGMSRVLELLNDYRETPEGRQMLARAMLGMGEILLGEKKSSEAEERFHEAIRLDGGLWRARAGLAESLLLRGKTEAAVEAAQGAIAGGDSRSSTRAILGSALAALGRNSEALTAYDDALRLDKDNLAALRGRGELRLTLGQYEPAVSDLKAALSRGVDAHLYLRLGWAFSKMERPDEALSHYRAALEIDPASNEARMAVAALTIREGSSVEAIKQLESLIATEPNRADLRAQLGDLYLAEQPLKALEQYLTAVKIEPMKVSHRIGLGSVLVRLRRMEEAIPVLRQALAMHPSADTVYYAHTNLGTALFEIGDFAGAIPEFQWILEHQTDEKRIPVTLYFLGICYDKLGEYEHALRIYQQFLARAGAANQLEVEKVKLRMPSLQRQIRDGKGKRKP